MFIKHQVVDSGVVQIPAKISYHVALEHSFWLWTWVKHYFSDEENSVGMFQWTVGRDRVPVYNEQLSETLDAQVRMMRKARVA